MELLQTSALAALWEEKFFKIKNMETHKSVGEFSSKTKGFWVPICACNSSRCSQMWECACWNGRLCGRRLPPRIALLFFNSVFNNCGWERHWETLRKWKKVRKKCTLFIPICDLALFLGWEHRLLVSRNMNENSRSFYFFHFFFLPYTAVQVNVWERPRHSRQPLAMLRII